MNEKPTIEVGKVPIITKFIYTLGVLPSSYLMSMTYQEQVTWLCNYIQATLIPQINEDVEAIQELQNLYELLRTYVNEYFDNLDVQEEINNKLEKMTEDGSLTALIENYINPLINNQNLRIDNIENKVNSVVNYTPIPVSSTDEMTDTTKSYLLTTDGYWYYYNGSAWTRGGLYQATSETNTINSIQDYLAHYEKDMTLQTDNKSILVDFEIPLYNGDIIDYYSVISQPSNNTIKTSVLYGYKNGSWEQLINYKGQYNSNDIVLVNDNYEKLRFYYAWTNADTSLTGNVKFNIIRANNFNDNIYNIMNDNGVIELHTNKIEADGWVYDYTRPIPAYKNFYIRFTNLDLINFDYLAIFGNIEGTYTKLYSTRNTEITGSDLINKIIKLSSTTNLNGIRVYYHPINISNTIYENNKFNLCIGENNVLSSLYNKTNELINKKFSICGVSIDTYTGYIPDGNVPYYNDTNLGSVNNTWWKKLIDKTGLKLVVNNSWTGSRASTSNGVESSGVHRCLNLHTKNDTPDIIFVGAFALNDWLYSEIGSYQIGETLPDMNIDLTNSANYNTWKDKTDKYEYALATMFYRIQQKYPNAKIYAFDSYNYYRNGSYPTYSGNKSISACNDSLYKIAKIFGIEIIKLSECGITYINSRDLCVETGNVALHPNINGQELLFEEIIKYL